MNGCGAVGGGVGVGVGGGGGGGGGGGRHGVGVGGGVGGGGSRHGVGGGPGRGRPPKNSVWSRELGKYVTRRPVGRPPQGKKWSASENQYIPKTTSASSQDIPHAVSSPNSDESWNSDEMNEVVFHIGPRQNPYRVCTRHQRDVSGQYQTGYYAQQVGG